MRVREPLDEHWRDHRSDESGNCSWYERQSCFQRRQSQHELEILRNEEIHSAECNCCGELSRNRGSEFRYLEQLHIDQWMLQPALSEHEQDPDGDSTGCSRDGKSVQSILREPLDAVDNEQHRNERHTCTQQVERAGVGVS